VAALAPERLTVKVSFGSTATSPLTAIVTGLLVSLAPKLSPPLRGA
jgi:hypothetical protein